MYGGPVPPARDQFRSVDAVLRFKKRREEIMNDTKEIWDITEDEIAMLEACGSTEDWNAACTKIKEARGGSYPPDWWPKVKMSGMMDRILAKWGATSEIKIAVPVSTKGDA